MNLKLSLALILLLSLPFVSAYNGWGYGYSFSPADLLQNEWVVFGLMFVGFFAVIFFSLGKTFKGNIGASVAIAAIISFFISAIFSQRVTFYGYVGEDLGGWILLIGLLVVLVFLLKLMLDLLGAIGLAAGVIGIWLLIHYVEWDFVLPYTILDSWLFNLIKSWVGFFIFAVIAVIIFAKRKAIKESIEGQPLIKAIAQSRIK